MRFLILISCILFPRTSRAMLIIAGLALGIAGWATISFWSVHYERWVACGRPTVGTCVDQR